MIEDFEFLLGSSARTPRFVIFASYGNDSVALIQWAHEQGLEDVTVVYSDTGWAARFWDQRVRALETWVASLGFKTARTSSVGFRGLALAKKGFPTQQYQWCSYILKIEPGERWLRENDPEGRAICLVGVRRDESQDRASFPMFLLRSASHGGRPMVAPMVEWTVEIRDVFIKRAGVEPLPHRSMECSPCVNSNKRDLQALGEEDVAKAEALEAELHETFGLTSKGKRRTFFRPQRHLGATGVREVVKWAHSKRGQYQPPPGSETEFDDDEDLGAAGCEAGWCGT